MFGQMVNQLLSSGEREKKKSVKVLCVVRQSNNTEVVKSRFRYDDGGEELQEAIQAALNKATRGSEVIVIRDIDTRMCAVFGSHAETIKVMGAKHCNFVTKRLSASYHIDDFWQFKAIKAGTTFDVKNLFPEPLLPVPSGLRVSHNSFHLLIGKVGENNPGNKKLVVGLREALRVTKLTKRAFYNLSLAGKQGLPWSDITVEVATLEDVVAHKDYVPRDYCHIIYKECKPIDAWMAKAPIAFGVRFDRPARDRILSKFVEAKVAAGIA